MVDKMKSAPEAEQTNREKGPDEWVTDDESMTGAQASYLKTLCEEAGEVFDNTLSKADASKRIEELQAKTGRGINH
jgi:NTP pyrophosphatase (non-canonical NTP hydrolase)